MSRLKTAAAAAYARAAAELAKVRTENTPRRKRMAESARSQALRDRQAALVAMRISEAQEQGRFGPVIKSMLDVERVMITLRDGRGKIDRRYEGVAVDHTHEDANNAAYYASDKWERMGVRSESDMRVLLNAVVPFTRQSVYSDPDDDKSERIRKLENEVRFADIPGFFPTPPGDLMDEAIRLAELKPGLEVLEPSAGKGDLASRIRDAGCKVKACEINFKLYEILKLKGFDALNADCINLSGVFNYDRIVMNPPFENGQDRQHVMHCYEKLLSPGGILVAIMSTGPFFRESKADREFKEWAEKNKAYISETYHDAFKGSDKFRETSVSVRILAIKKPLKVPIPYPDKKYAPEPAPSPKPIDRLDPSLIGRKVRWYEPEVEGEYGIIRDRFGMIDYVRGDKKILFFYVPEQFHFIDDEKPEPPKPDQKPEPVPLPQMSMAERIAELRKKIGTDKRSNDAFELVSPDVNIQECLPGVGAAYLS